MKNLKYLLLLFPIAISIAACGGNALCKDIDCGLGECVKGECICDNVDCGHGTCAFGACVCEEGWQIGADLRCSQELPCHGVDCGHGTCLTVDETCLCDDYYETDSTGKCTREQREKFLGTWTGIHITSDGDTVGPYSMTVTPIPNDIQFVQITNFCNFNCITTGSGLVVNARIHLENSLALFESFCTGWSTFAGSWTSLDDTHLRNQASAVNGSTIIHCDGVFTKQ